MYPKFPNNQLHTEKVGGHYALFVAMLHLLQSVTNVQETSLHEPVTTESAGKKCGQIHTEK